MRRLQVREGTACLLWVVYDFMMLLLLWALAALVVLGVMILRAKGMTETHAIGPQSLILAYYGSALLHNLLPAGDAMAWVSHAVALVACAVGCVDVEGLAGEARRHRTGHRRDTDCGRLVRGRSELGVPYYAHSGPGRCHWAYHLQLEGGRRG